MNSSIENIKSKIYTYIIFYINDNKMKTPLIETNCINEVIDFIKNDETKIENECKYIILTLNSETEKQLGLKLQEIKPFRPYFSIKVN